MPMSIFMGLEIGKRSIMTHQTALNITGHNLANTNTEGYTRQVPTIVTTRPYYTPSLTSYSGVGQQGTGVQVASIERIRDAFLDSQIRNENKTTGYWTAMQDTLARIEVILNEPSEDGLRSVMDQFWEAWQDLSANPESDAVRTVVTERGAAMADAFNHTYRQLVELRDDVNACIQIKVDEINSLAQQIADLNKQIMAVTSAGQRPNDLLDKRDLLVEQLSKIIDINVRSDQLGMISLQIGGRPLVQGKDIAPLSIDSDGQGLHQVVWADTQTAVRIESGELRGLLDARGPSKLDAPSANYAGVVPKLIEELNELAKTIILETNKIHRTGYSLNNDTDTAHGTNFFVEPADSTDLSINWAAIMQVEDAIYDNPMNIAAASAPTWQGDVEANFGDGSNALLIAQLKHKKLSIGINYCTCDDYWRAICSETGVMSQEAQRMVHNQNILLNELENKRQSVSGVYMDEEMTNMIKFQHAYNAASRFITTIDEAIDVIVNRMGLVGR
jgi:flagellar hook-associated protein 1 FlgK